MKQKTVIIVAGGELYDGLIDEIRDGDIVIGVDRGAWWLISHSINPAVAIGDFDSVSAKERSVIKKKSGTFITHPKEKDATDLELAVEYAMGLAPSRVTLFGVVGSRMDHTMAGIALLQRLESHNIIGVIVDKFNKINIVRHQQRIKSFHGLPYISFIALNDDATVTLTGLRYPLVQSVLAVGSSLGISNEIISSSASIRVHKGTVLMIQSADAAVR
jgi:thiamine pyrophosphokinase